MLLVEEAPAESFVVCMQRQSFSIPGLLSESLERAIDQAVVYLPIFNPSCSMSLPSISSLASFFHECQREFVRGRAEGVAFEAAKSFEGIPESVLDDSISELNNHFQRDLSSLIRKTQESKAVDRFNETRCREVFSGDPEFQTLLTLAKTGAVVPIEENFEVQSSPEPLRKLHIGLD
jgi:hypothetical protein